jgi:hypothetical protein
MKYNSVVPNAFDLFLRKASAKSLIGSHFSRVSADLYYATKPMRPVNRYCKSLVLI